MSRRRRKKKRRKSRKKKKNRSTISRRDSILRVAPFVSKLKNLQSYSSIWQGDVRQAGDKAVR